MESSSPHHVGLLGAVVQATGAGSLLGSLVRTLLRAALGDDGIKEGGWRLAFLFGSLIALLAFFLRRSMHSTPAFLALQRRRQILH